MDLSKKLKSGWDLEDLLIEIMSKFIRNYKIQVYKYFFGDNNKFVQDLNVLFHNKGGVIWNRRTGVEKDKKTGIQCWVRPFADCSFNLSMGHL